LYWLNFHVFCQVVQLHESFLLQGSFAFFFHIHLTFKQFLKNAAYLVFKLLDATLKIKINQLDKSTFLLETKMLT